MALLSRGERCWPGPPRPERLRRVLTKMLDEGEFLSPYGIRSVSKFHERHSYVFHVHRHDPADLKVTPGQQ
jgi:hypothetical protein